MSRRTENIPVIAPDSSPPESGKYVREHSFLAIMATFFALFFFIGFGIKTYNAHQSKICTEPVHAVVIELERHRSSSKGGGSTYAPVFAFEYQGEEYEVVSRLSSNPPEYRKNQEVDMFINPEDPYDIYVPDSKSMKLFYWLFMLIGGIPSVIMYVISIKSFIKYKRFQKGYIDETATDSGEYNDYDHTDKE